jgi:hypothetical protein
VGFSKPIALECWQLANFRAALLQKVKEIKKKLIYNFLKFYRKKLTFSNQNLLFVANLRKGDADL